MKGKIAGIFRKINSDIRYQIGVFLVLMAACFLTYLVSVNLIREVRRKAFEPVPDNFSWMYQLESAEIQGKQVVLSGWAFQLNIDSQPGSFEIILQNVSTGKAYYPDMDYFPREDVNDYFLCEYDYVESGFRASIEKKRLDLDNTVYEILLRPEGSRKAYSSGIYYASGEIQYANPKEFVALKTEGTDLETITEDGILRVYRPDVGMYVYQYKGELYWIADQKYGFVEGDTSIQFQMDTTQINQLPEIRRKNNWFWSNIGFSFKKNELTEWNTGQYRVAKCPIPTDYSVTRIWTGNYIDGWVWKQYFRMYYEFIKE